MAFKSLSLLSALASVALALTPQGFVPASQNSLVVAFGNNMGLDGQELPQAVTKSEPQIGTLSKLDGSTFAVFMVDLDIPTGQAGKTNTLLHWAQTGLVQSTTPASVGGTNAFMLRAKEGQKALSAYFGPNPPAKEPLTHRYTQVLVDTSSATNEDLAALEAAAKTKQGFNLATALQQAKLADKVVAGNFFTVTNAASAAEGGQPKANSTNPRPSRTSGTPRASGSTGPSASARPTSGRPSATRPAGTGGLPSRPTQTGIPIATAHAERASMLALSLAVAAAVCWAL